MNCRRWSLSRDQLLLKLEQPASSSRRGWLGSPWLCQRPASSPMRRTSLFKLRTGQATPGGAAEDATCLRSNHQRSGPVQLTDLPSTHAVEGDLQRPPKTNLSLRPIFHQLERRIRGAYFPSLFWTYCLHVHFAKLAFQRWLWADARSCWRSLAAIQMLDVHFPTTDGRELVFARYTQPEKDHKMLLSQLGWELPRNLHPESQTNANCSRTNSLVADLFDSTACLQRTYESIPRPVAKVG